MMDDVFSKLSRRLDANAVAGVPKHVRLREAIFGAIRDGCLKAGDQIAPEQMHARDWPEPWELYERHLVT